MLQSTNSSLHQPLLYARRKPPAGSAVSPLEEARSSSLGWEARAKALRIVTSSSSVRVGAAVPPKSGCLRYWRACGRVYWPRSRCPRDLAALVHKSVDAVQMTAANRNSRLICASRDLCVRELIHDR